ncbi:TetR/AcrR family transcriptional regulator [Streptomyces monashensis]
MPGGRPRSYDPEAALDAAMRTFWTQGYEGTAMSDLTTAMRMSAPSIYAAFGDKKTLFEKVVERYMAGPGAYLQTALDQPTAEELARTFLHAAVEAVAGDAPPRLSGRPERARREPPLDHCAGIPDRASGRGGEVPCRPASVVPCCRRSASRLGLPGPCATPGHARSRTRRPGGLGRTARDAPCRRRPDDDVLATPSRAMLMFGGRCRWSAVSARRPAERAAPC